MVDEINEIDYAGFFLLREWGSPPPVDSHPPPPQDFYPSIKSQFPCPIPPPPTK